MRSAAVAAALLLLAIAGGVLMATAGGSEARFVVGMTLFGAAGVIAVALVFYAVGRSEDRDRAREEEARRRR